SRLSAAADEIAPLTLDTVRGLLGLPAAFAASLEAGSDVAPPEAEAAASEGEGAAEGDAAEGNGAPAPTAEAPRFATPPPVVDDQAKRFATPPPVYNKK